MPPRRYAGAYPDWRNWRLPLQDENDRIRHIVQQGLPVRLEVSGLSDSYICIWTRPRPGFVHLSSDEGLAYAALQGYDYHLSLCEWGAVPIGSADQVSYFQIVQKWHGRDVVLRVREVAETCTVILADDEPLVMDRDVWVLRQLNPMHEHGPLSISAGFGDP